MLTTALALLCVVLLLICVDFRLQLQRANSRHFIERHELQSKIDILTEAMMRDKNFQLDLNRDKRNIFKQRVDRAFKGFRTDLPATPPISPVKGRD